VVWNTASTPDVDRCSEPRFGEETHVMASPSATRKRVQIGIVAILALVIVAVAMLFSTLVWPVGCGGDGGSPYAALASPRGEYCELTRDSAIAPLFMVLFLAPLAVTPLAAVIAAVKARFMPLMIGIAIAVVALGAVLAPMMVLESHCTPEQRASLPGRQCETYN
jgi:hypothetical protein